MAHFLPDRLSVLLLSPFFLSFPGTQARICSYKGAGSQLHAHTGLHAPFLARLWDYPTRPLTLIVPFAAGGTKADFAGRVANVRFRG